jgi:septum site-determining protein MinD
MLAIAGGKGGSGKTTTTLGLAAAVDRPTLAVDADVDAPNLHALAGVDRGAALGACAPGDAPEYDDGTRVLAAPGDGDRRAVARALDRLAAASTPPVLVDCPAGAGPPAAAPLRVVDAALVVTTACGPALRDAVKTAEMARALDTAVVGAVLTRTRVAPDGVDALLGCPVLATVPEAGSAAGSALASDVVRAAYERLASAVVRGESFLRTEP